MVRGMIRQKCPRLNTGRQLARNPPAHANSPSTRRTILPTRSFGVDMDHPFPKDCQTGYSTRVERSLLGLRYRRTLSAQEKSPREHIPVGLRTLASSLFLR